MKIKLAKSELIHFVGIGGIGMSGLALIMKGKGFKVQGSDISNNKNIERLRKEKIKVFIGHKKQNINKGTILVISSAIKKNNPELVAAKKKQLPIYKRGKKLANIDSLKKNKCPLFINQDISIWRCKYNLLNKKYLPSGIEKFNWIQIIEGDLLVRDKNNKSSKKLYSGDGLGFEISDFSDIDIQSDTYVDMLLFSMTRL